MADVEPTNLFLEFTGQWKPAIDFFGALLTPMIAVAIAYVAWQQHKTNKRRLRFELYEKRFAIYVAVVDFLSVSPPQGTMTEPGVDALFGAWLESRLLFHTDEIADYIKELEQKGQEQLHVDRYGKNKDLIDEERERLKAQDWELHEYFTAQPERAHALFRKHISMGR